MIITTGRTLQTPSLSFKRHLTQTSKIISAQTISIGEICIVKLRNYLYFDTGFYTFCNTSFARVSRYNARSRPLFRSQSTHAALCTFAARQALASVRCSPICIPARCHMRTHVRIPKRCLVITAKTCARCLMRAFAACRRFSSRTLTFHTLETSHLHTFATTCARTLAYLRAVNTCAPSHLFLIYRFMLYSIYDLTSGICFQL